MSKRSLSQPEASPELRRRVKNLLHRGGSRTLQRVVSRSVAVCSGKGGVGKTITAANLAILCARRGLRVALVDLDPLSDVATLLDLTESETALEPGKSLENGSLADFTLHVFENLDLVFPNPKLDRGSREALLDNLFRRHVECLAKSYDLLVFDLPAGSDYEENLVFLLFVSLIILVTNPEPTAHAAAGSYIRRALRNFPETSVHIWHNRYATGSQGEFNPRDVAGNYNRNVPAEEKLKAQETRRLVDLAFVPEDPALNLLRGSPAAGENAHRFLIDTLKYFDEERVRMLAVGVSLSRFALELSVHYVAAHGAVEDAEETLQSFGSYLRQLVDHSGDGQGRGLALFSPEERASLSEFLERVRRDWLRGRVLKLIGMLEERLQQLEAERGPFAPGLTVQADKAVDRELSALLVELNRQARSLPELVPHGGLLLFYFSLYKLLQSPTVSDLIGRLVPTRKSARGGPVRDRNRQIRTLVEGDPDYRQRYLKAVRTLYPVVVRQVTNMVKVLDLSGLLLRGGDGKVLRSAYLKLLTNFLHDTLYSGLSVVVGFPYRASGRAFHKGAGRVLELMGLGGPGEARPGGEGGSTAARPRGSHPGGEGGSTAAGSPPAASNKEP
jgi:MinD-like ATPase involved in chromosome partitioning or flagellar assembly